MDLRLAPSTYAFSFREEVRYFRIHIGDSITATVASQSELDQ